MLVLSIGSILPDFHMNLDIGDGIMTLKLYYGNKSQHEHEFQQLKEIIDVISTGMSDRDIYVMSNVLVSNGEIDCVLVTSHGPIILELKNYCGEIIGDENSDWFARQDEQDVPLNGNLFVQLKTHRNDLFNKLDRIRGNYFNRVEGEDLRKISAWGYFNRGSKYSDYQINQNIVKWFDIVTADNLIEKISWINTGYTLFPSDMDTIVQELHLTEWDDEMKALLDSPSNIPEDADNPLSGDVLDEVCSDCSDLRSNNTDEISSKDQLPEQEKNNIINMIENMAATGHAPEDGCRYFSVGNEKYVDAIKKTYFERSFSRGNSAEKFIVGPFGSGKTHFLNQLCEEGRALDCVTATVSLNKLTDVTSNYFIYRGIANGIRTPEATRRGIPGLLSDSLEKIQSAAQDQSSDKESAEELVKLWLDSIEECDFESALFAKIVQKAFKAKMSNDTDLYDVACRWIGGEFENKEISKILDISPINKPELNITAKRVNLSLYQLIKKVGYRGTIIAFDEAEQGFEISKSQQSKLYSLMQSEINSINDLRNGSVLVLYAIVPAILDGMMNFPALQQRVQHPIPFEKNPRAALIEINRGKKTKKEDIIEELFLIGTRLADLMYKATGDINVPRWEIEDAMRKLAEKTYAEDMNISDRRMMVKSSCSFLMTAYETGMIPNADDFALNGAIPFEDDEV